MQNGINTFTGGTATCPSINITSATLANLSTSGTNTATQFSATTISAGTIYSITSGVTLIGQINAGSNVSGGTLTISSGQGTGAGTAPFIYLQTPTSLSASGTTNTQQTLSNRWIIGSDPLNLLVPGGAGLWPGVSNPTTTNFILRYGSLGTSMGINGGAGGLSLSVNSTTKIFINGTGAINTNTTNSPNYNTTNSTATTVTTHLLVDPANSTTAGISYSFDASNGFGINQGNGSVRVQGVKLQPINLISTAGNESMSLGVYAQTSGTVATLVATFSSTGLTLTSGITTPNNIINGVSGNGYVQLMSQAIPPTGITGNLIISANASTVPGLQITTQNAANSATINQNFVFPNSSTTFTFPTPTNGNSDSIVLLNTTNVFSQNNIFNANVTANNFFGNGSNLTGITLQTTYNNSSIPQIITNSSLDGLAIQNGSGSADNITKLFKGESSGGTITSIIRADGYISGTSIYYNSLLSTGNLTFVDTNVLASFQSNINNYNQIILQNTSGGASGSTDFIVSNNLSTSTSFYGDFGMNGSGYTGLGSINIPNAVYLTSINADLVIGTMTSNSIHVITNGSTGDTITISSGGTVTFNSSNGTQFSNNGIYILDLGTSTYLQALSGSATQRLDVGVGFSSTDIRTATINFNGFANIISGSFNATGAFQVAGSTTGDLRILTPNGTATTNARKLYLSSGGVDGLGTTASGESVYIDALPILTGTGRQGGIVFFNTNTTPAWNNLQRGMYIGNAISQATASTVGGTYVYSWNGSLNVVSSGNTFITLGQNSSFATASFSGNLSFSNSSKGVVGVIDGSNSTSGNVGEIIFSGLSSYTNYTTTAAYQNIISVTLNPGDWLIQAFGTFNSNTATITAAANAIFVIATATTSASGSIEGQTISYIPQAALIGTSKESSGSMMLRTSISASTTYYLNTQSTFTLGNPQFVGSLLATRIR